MQDRIDRTNNELKSLVSSDLGDDSKIIRADKYQELWLKAKKILAMFLHTKDVKTQPPVQMLLDIENHIERADTYIRDNELIDKETFQAVLKGVKKDIKTENGEEAARIKKELELRQHEMKRKKDKKPTVPKNVRQDRPVTLKAPIPRKKEKKIEFTQLQLDMLKYGGEALFNQCQDIDWDKLQQ